MNEQNLVKIETRSPEEQFAIRSKGGKNSQKKIKERKEEAKKRESLIAILKEFLFSEVKPNKLKKLLKSTGANDNDYGSALIASTILKGIQKGDMNSLIKLIEVLGESEENVKRETEADKSFNNLIEAIKNVREVK